MKRLGLTGWGLVVAGLLLVSGSAWADQNWTNGSGDNLWSTAGNWSPSGVPDTASGVVGVDLAAPQQCVIDGVAEADYIEIGAAAPGELIIDGGSLTCNYIRPGFSGFDSAAASFLRVLNGGALTATGEYGGFASGGDLAAIEIGGSATTVDFSAAAVLSWPADANALLTMSGGTMNIGTDLVIAGGPDSTADVIMSGGTIVTGNRVYLASYSDVNYGGPNADGSLTLSGDALVDCGHDCFLGYTADSDAVLNMTGGTLDLAQRFYAGLGNADVTVNLDGGSIIARGSGGGAYITHQLSVGGHTTIDMTDGSMTFYSKVNFDNNAAAVVDFTMSGGTFSATDYLMFGRLGTTNLDMSGGEMSCSRLFVSYQGTSNVTISGGTMTANTLYMANSTGSVALVELAGGVLAANSIAWGSGPTKKINITEGALQLPAGQTATVQGWITSGYLTGYDASDTLLIIDDGVNTTVTADEFLTSRAGNPQPIGTVPGAEYNSTVLTWTAGPTAVQHDVYFGTDYDAVANAAKPGSPEYQTTLGLGSESWITPTLELGQVYYWRIDEVDGGSNIIPGTVWTFSVADHVAAEDFSYADDAALQAAWSGMPTLAVVDDANALCLAYDTTVAPYQVGSTRTFAVPQDWTQAGVEALHVWVWGELTNDPEPVYVTLSDGTNTATVLHDDGDVVVRDYWQPLVRLVFPLAQFVGVDAQHITSVTLGVGDGAAAGGTGTAYFQYLSLYIPVYLADYAPRKGDLNGSQTIDLADVGELSASYGKNATVVAAESLSSTGLLVHYNFDETSGSIAADSSGNGIDGQVRFESNPVTDGWDAAGYQNGCLNFRGRRTVYGTNVFSVKVAADTYNPGALAGIDDEITVAMWLLGDPCQPEDDVLFDGTDTATSAVRLAWVHLPLASGTIYWDTGGPSSDMDRVAYSTVSALQFKQNWNHYAFVKNVNTGVQTIYLNGVKIAEATGKTKSMSGMEFFELGGHHDGRNWQWHGRIDEFHLYDRALSQGEIITLAGQASVVQPLLADDGAGADIDGDGDVDLEDLQFITDNWLGDALWP